MKGRWVRLELTELEAAELFAGANVRAEEIRTAHSAAELGKTPAEVAAFWRAMDKLQRARLER